MRMGFFLSLLFLGMMTIAGPAFAQNPTPKKEESIEDLFLSTPGLRIAYEAARADDRESKLLAITQINEMLEEGVSAKDEEQITVILRDLSAQGTSVLIREKGRLINYYVDVRRESCRVLSLVKTDEAKKKAVKILIEVLRTDDDPIVKAHAAYALGVIGRNDNEEAARALALALESQDYVAPNDNFAYSGIVALEKIAKANDGIGDPNVMRVLVKITQGNYNRTTVKEKALQVMKTIRSLYK